MSSQDLDRRLAGWFDSSRDEYVPQGLLDDVFSVTRASRQRRGLVGRVQTAVPEWWRTPMFWRVAPQRLAYLIVLALLIVAAAFALASIGSFRHAPPFGLASNGLVAFDRDGVIVLARPDGTEISQVTTVPNARGPVFSPDGSRFAFYGTVDGSDTIFVASTDGGDPIAVSTGIDVASSAVGDAAGNGGPPISWSPDSKNLVFSGLSGKQPELFVATVDGSHTQSIGDAALSRLDPAWSPDGAWIAFHGFRPEQDAAAGQYRTTAGLYLIRPDGQDQQLLEQRTGGDFIFRKPRWLPDPAQRILAYSVGEPSEYDIAVFDATSMTEHVISRAPAAEIWPVWAPDGSALAWVASDGNITIARLDGTIIRTLHSPIDYELVWSPDGAYLFGFTTESRTAMVVLSIDGSSATSSFPVQGRSHSFWSWQRRAP